MMFAPFSVEQDCGETLTRFYQQQVRGRSVLLVDDVRNTGQTFARCASLVRDAGGEVIATAAIYDRMEATVDIGVPNFALAEYKAPDNYPAAECPLCRTGTPVATF
jgi:orotate phosphoribosyltransferase